MKISEKLSDSPTLLFAESVRKRKSEGKDIISMGIGEPDVETPQFIIDKLIETANNKSLNGYVYSGGIIELRKKISTDLMNRKGFSFDENQILVTSGAKQAIQLILTSLLKPQDEIVYLTPCYVSYLPQILLSEPDAVARPIAMTADFNIDLEAFKKSVNSKTKVILLNTPHNPTGKMFTKEAFLQIAEIALQNDVYIILDDVYELLIYNKQDDFSLATLESLKEKLFFVNSFSKSHAIPGWRIGYLAAPKKEMSQLLKIQQHSLTNISSIIQYACLSIFDNGYQFLEDYIKKLINRSNYIHEQLSQVISNKIVKPQGGFFYFIDVSEFGLSSNDFCSQLIDFNGVALTPGIAFGEDWDNYVRLSFGVSEVDLVEAIKRIKDFIVNIKKAKNE